MDEVCRRLGAVFPHLPEGQIRATVEAVYSTLTGPVRDYVPLLVERESRDVLGGLTRRDHAAAS